MNKFGNLVRLGHVSFLDLLKQEHPVHDHLSHVEEAMKWLCLAQDSTDDGGVSEGFHLYHGWLPSYPETTGYIIETFLSYSKLKGLSEYKDRALRMTRWLLSIKNDDGSIPDSYFKQKLVFDTGQVLFGLTAIYLTTGEETFREAAKRAGDWILSVQEDDGSWARYGLNGIPHSYYSRVAWGLLKLHEITGEQRYVDGCVRNIEWTLKQQEPNGWFHNAAFRGENQENPYTHTIAYTMRGILETGLCLNEDRYVSAVVPAMDGMIDRIHENGFVPATFDKTWRGNEKESCLTGCAQLSIILLRMFQKTGESRYRDSARRINRFLKHKQELRTHDKRIYGAIAGSYPIWGSYIHFTYPNWATKFFVDALLLETSLEENRNG
jgi:uncharacterized protein YyaL (SSP411 family)